MRPPAALLFLKAAGLSCALLTGSGCAWLTAREDDVLPPWRIAEVVALGPRASWSKPLTSSCADPAVAANPEQVFAVLAYRDGPRHARRLRTARIPLVMDLRVQDRVRFNTEECLIGR